MPDTPDRPIRHHRTAGVDPLDRALDAAIAGRATALPGDALDPEMAATIDTLWTMHARSTPPGPDAAFVARLREDLMHASPLPLPVPAQPHRRDTNARPSRSRLPFAAWATSGVGAFSTILTIGVAIALIVASVGWWDRAGTPPAPTPSEVAFAAATPSAPLDGTPLASTPAAALDVPPVSTAGGPGRSWRLSDTDPRTDGLPRQIAADANLAVMSALVVGDSIVVSGTDTTSQYGMGSIRRIDLRTGATIWRVPAKPRGDLAAQGDLLYTFTVDSKRVSRLKLRVSAFSLSTGEEVWTGPELDVGSDTLAGYGPVLLDGMLYATDPAGNTIALDAATGATAWQYPASTVTLPVTANADSSMLAVQGDTEPWVFVTTLEGRIVRLSGITGEVRATTDAHADAQSLKLLAADSRYLFVSYVPAKGGDGAGIGRLTAATLKSPGALDGFAFTANPIPEPGGSLLASTATMIDGDYVITLGRIMPSDDQRQRLGDEASLDIGPLPHIDTMSLAGDTVMGLTGDGGLVFVNVETREVTLAAVPVAAPRTTLPLRPLLWGDVPVIVASDGTIWALDGAKASDASSETGPVIAFDDTGFVASAFDATAGGNGIAALTLRNDGTEPRIITIPSLGIDAHIPAHTSITIERTIPPYGAFAAFARTDRGIDPTPGFFAVVSITGAPAPASARWARGTEGVYTDGVSVQVAPDTAVLAVPGDATSTISAFSDAGTLMPLSVGEPPSNGTARVTDANGTEWTLVLVGADMIGWVPSSSLSPRDSDQTLLPPATPDASSPAEGNLNANAENLRITIDLDGAIAGDPGAIQQLDEELQRVFAPYGEAGTCTIGFVLISTRSPDVATGIAGSDAVASRIIRVLPSLLPTAPDGDPTLVSESIALSDTQPEGEVQLQVFFNTGCTPVTPEASPAS